MWKERRVAKGKAGSGRCEPRISLGEELEALRSSLKLACQSLNMADADVARLGGLVARLCDSIVRAALAQRKLAASDDTGLLRAEIQRILREVGLGE